MHVVYNHKKGKRKWIVIVIIAVVIFINPFDIFGFLRRPITFLSDPIIKTLQSSAAYIKNTTSVVTNIGSMHSDNEKLSAEVSRLEADIARLRYIEDENVALRVETGLEEKTVKSEFAAEVVMRDSFGGNQWIVIDKGETDGVVQDMAVTVHGHVFIGHVDLIEHGRARVQLITHPESVINVAISDNKAEAVAVGSHGLAVHIQDIPKDVEIKNGEMVLTSNLSGRFIRGLALGKIHSTSQSSDQLYKNAQIEPLVDLSEIRFVTLVQKSL